MENYFDSKDKRACVGCGVCALKCPKDAIQMFEDEEGFLYPTIDAKKCINCGLCRKVCPNKVYKLNDYTKTYIVINKNKKSLNNSASGGAFSVIAEYVLSLDGIVFGVTFDKGLNAQHIYIDKHDDLIRLQGSKYVRSDLNNSYAKAKEFLDSGKLVLFSGTPCQCQGLKLFLNKRYENLITIEVICHANPSPKVFKMYLENLEMIYGVKVKNINFRDKQSGWKNQIPTIEFVNGTRVYDNSYMMAFCSELINRPSCNACNFASTNRLSDFTIGDAWGIGSINTKIKDDDTGISILCVNSEKANQLFAKLKEKMLVTPIDTMEIFKYNHYKNLSPNKNRNKFFRKMSNGEINSKNVINYFNCYSRLSFIARVKNKLKRILKLK